MAKHGIDIYFEVWDSVGMAWVQPAEQEAGTLNRSQGPVDITSKDSLKWTKSIPGDRSWDMTFTALFDETDVGYLLLEGAWEANEQIQVRGFDGTRYHSGFAEVSDMGIDAPDDDAARYNPTLNGSGVLTIT